jgi:hypothetical protein
MISLAFIANGSRGNALWPEVVALGMAVELTLGRIGGVGLVWGVALLLSGEEEEGEGQ